MQIKSLFLIVSLAVLKLSYSQNNFKSLEMDDNLQQITLADSLLEENAVILKLDFRHDFVRNEEGDLMVYESEHKIVKINHEKAIDKYNTYYVSDRNVLEWVTLSARTIDANGKITAFDKSNIKEVVDEESGNSYKIFAVDGIEEGNIVEFLIVKKMHAGSFNRIYFQYSNPLLQAAYAISCPSTLRYEIKCYNGYMKAQDPLFEKETNHYSFVGMNIPATASEPFSYTNPNKVRIEYRLDRNYDRGKYKLLTWDNAAQNVYSTMFDLSKKENSSLEAFVESIALDDKSDKQKIIALNDIVKKDFLFQEQDIEQYNQLDIMLNDKVASEKGLTKLFLNAFKCLNVPAQAVITCERNSVKFDKDFQSWNYLDKYLIYFPSENMFLAPSSLSFPAGLIPPMLSGQFAMFVRPVSVNTFKSAVADIKYIQETGSAENFDNMYIHVALNEALDSVVFDMERAMKGHSGGYLARVLEWQDQIRREKTLEGLSALDDLSPEYHSLKVVEKSENERAKDAEFVFEVKASSASLLQQAGNKILFQLGLTIGTQAEMYREDDRKMDVENFFNRSYYREITFMVPDGFRITNPDVANIVVRSDESEEAPYVFESKASYVDNQYKVIINEYYNQLFAPKEEYEPFRQVVNAAADFNKVVLVLEKK